MKIEWLPRAEINLQSILEHILLENPSAAFALVDAITDSVTSMLSDHPNVGRHGRVEGTREWVAHKNYVVAYRVLPDRVQILSVMHTSRLWPVGF